MVHQGEKIKAYSPLLPLLVVILGFGLGYLVIQPKISELKDLNSRIAAKNKDIANLQEKINNLKILQNKFAQASQEVELLKVALATDEQMAEIIQQVQTIANRSGLLLKSLKPASGPAANETVLSIALEGGFANLLTFTENLEKNVRPASVKTINMSASSSLTGLVFEANLNVAFFINQNKSAAVSQANSQTIEEEK